MTDIVVVDDRASNRLIMSKLASSLGEDVQVMVFASPLTALTYVEDHTPDLLITDFKMEPFNGDELIRRFRCVPACADVPTVVITAFHDVAFRDRALKAGSTNFLSSPIDHDDFRSRLRGLLAIRRERKLLHAKALLSIAADGSVSGDQFPIDSSTEMVAAMLQDVNLHLVATLAELRLLQSDFDTVIGETQVAAIFVDALMNVRWATPAIQTLFGTDVGTPVPSLAAVTAKLRYHDLSQDFEGMLRSEEPVQRYLESNTGDHYVVKILPNHGPNRLVTGAVIAFTKIAAWHRGRA
jgi:CheY-like chemotaxis protein